LCWFGRQLDSGMRKWTGCQLDNAAHEADGVVTHLNPMQRIFIKSRPFT